MICGTLRWLLDHEEREHRQLRTSINELDAKKSNDDNGDDYDWLNQQAEQVKITQQRQLLQQQLNKIQRKDEKLEQLRSRKEKVQLQVLCFILTVAQ